MQKTMEIAIESALHDKASRGSVFGLGMVTCGLTIAFCVVLGGGWMLIQEDMARLEASSGTLENNVRQFNEAAAMMWAEAEARITMETTARLDEREEVISQAINGLNAELAKVRKVMHARDQNMTGIIKQVFELDLKDDQNVVWDQ